MIKKLKNGKMVRQGDADNMANNGTNLINAEY